MSILLDCQQQFTVITPSLKCFIVFSVVPHLFVFSPSSPAAPSETSWLAFLYSTSRHWLTPGCYIGALLFIATHISRNLSPSFKSQQNACRSRPAPSGNVEHIFNFLLDIPWISNRQLTNNGQKIKLFILPFLLFYFSKKSHQVAQDKNLHFTFLLLSSLPLHVLHQQVP